MKTYLFIGVAWLGYYALHSLLASHPIKRWVSSSFPSLWPAYRLLYSAIASIGLCALIGFHLKLPAFPHYLKEPIWFYLGCALLVIGSLFLKWAMKGYRTGEFIGLEQLNRGDIKDEPLVTNGMNRYVRHPLYLATLLVLIGIWFLRPDAPTSIGVSISASYLWMGSWLEERKLIAEYGEAYRTYQRNVPAILPLRWKRNR